MLVRADWVCPIATPPIRDGAVRICGQAIGAVGTFSDLAREYPSDPVEEYQDCVVLPGLVNAHTHLALTVLGGVLPSAPFAEWLPLVVRAKAALTEDDLAASTALGAHRALASGTTVVGEIAYSPDSSAIAAHTGLGGAFFWEVLGGSSDTLAERLSALAYPPTHGSATGEHGRQRFGITAHSPYTSGQDLLRAAHALAHEHGAAFALHVAESRAESELMRAGTGPLAEVALRSAQGFDVPGTSSVRYLDSLGILDGMLAIHCAELAGEDVPLIAERTAGVVLCPRSNAFLHVGPAPIEALASAGVRLALGTDSLASNDSLDLFDEARALRATAPALTPDRILRMMTADGARALGFAGKFGALAPGTAADLAIYRIEGGVDPYAALLARASRSTIAAVMAGGVWRVLGSRSTPSERALEARMESAARKASLALP